MSSTTHIFDIKLLQHSEDIFVVWCGSLLDDFELVLKNQLRIDAKKIIHWERLINQADFKGQIIIFKAVENLKEIEKFCLSSRKPIHFFAWHGGYDVNLIKSVNIENLKKRKRNSITSSLAKKLLQNFCEKKTTLIISAIPGMGKSVLMNYFAQKMPIHLWVLHIPLATYRDHYKNWEGQNIFSQQLKFEQFLLDIVKAQKKPNTKIFDEAFAQFINFKNVVFLLDGLDEVPVNLQNGAMQLIKFINQSGYYTCVTTSPLLQEQLESTLNTFAIKLNMFTKNEQTSFLTDYFENTRTAKPSNEKVEEFVCKLLKATKSNLNDFDQKFTGVPLQTKLLAEVFEKNLLKYLDDGIFRNERFDLIYLYEHFIKKKIEIAFAKVENVSEHMIDQYKQCRSFYALRHLFDEQDLEELKINERINVINDMLPLALQLIQKDGITIIDGDWNVTFVHQTYAEYLAANWLTENIKEHKEIVRKLYLKCFNWNFVVVRNMFDRILAKDYPLHTTVINCQVDTVETLILDENAFDATDRGGRTIVHLLSAWNSPLEWYTTVHDLIMDNLQSNTYTMLKNKLMHVEDEILHYSVLDYAILSRSFKAARFLICELKNPSSNIDITKTESDDIIRHMKWRRDMPLYIIILKCFIRTSFNEHEVKNIHKRIRNGDLHKVRSRIFDFDDPDSEGRTLLHAATKGGHKGTVRFLLKKKANVNKTDNNGRSALHWASYLGHMEIIYLLLSHGAKPDVTDCYNLTTYHYAILSSLENQVEVVSLLLSRNRTIATQNLNAFDKINYLNYRDKVHPVYLLDVETQQAVLNLILCHNVDANIKGFMGTTSLMFAAENNDVDSVKLLLANNADIHAVDDSNLTALHYAVIMGHGKVVTVLLTNNADVNARDSGNITPLHWAAYWCNQEAVTILLKYSADVNAKDPYNKTPLHYAAACNYQDVVTILLAHNADVNAKYPYNKTPPHWTAMHGNEDVVTILLKYSADVNGKYSYNKSPLHLAVEKGSQNIVTILLGNGANMHTKSVDNETPLDIAVRKGNQDIVTILTNANSKYK